MLNQIENNYLESKLKVKIQLLILPICLIYFYFYVEDKISVNSYSNSSLNNMNSLINKKFVGSYISLIKEIESFSSSEKIKIDFINYNKNKLLIKGKSSLENINKLITKVEYINSFSKINSFNIKKEVKSKEYYFEINSEFNKYYIKEKVLEETKHTQERIERFDLRAIISNNILLNNEWYSKNDLIGKYKIINIEKNLVVLEYQKNKIKLRLNKNE